MRRINYKSDFDFVLKLKECKGESQEAAEVPFPDCDWEAVFYTSSKANSYTASCKGGEYVNCFKDEGGIHLVFNDHRMGAGTLKWEPHFELPNDIYPDSIQDLFSKQQLGIELVNGPGDCPTTAEVEVLLPYIKGEPFTFEDFTPEQIEDLQKPATEAAERLDGFVKTASEAEAARELNEQSRVSAESERVSQEELRQTAETARQANETARQANETVREAAEPKRAEAEEQRESAEAKRNQAEVKRAEAENARVLAESKRVSAEIKRVDAESARESAEAKRGEAENMRKANETSRINTENARGLAEGQRISNETAREAAEAKRAEAEDARRTAETERAAEFATWETELDGKQDNLSTTTDLHITNDNIIGLTDMAKKRLFIDMWNTAAGEYGTYNEQTGYFELNGLTDITYEEAILIYSKWSNSNLIREQYWGAKIRTNIPQPLRDIVNAESAFYESSIEVVNLTYTNGWVRCSSQSGIFRRCRYLKRISPVLQNIGQDYLDFEHCYSLEEVRINNLNPKDLYLSSCSKLSFDSVDHIIRNGTSKGFTVHVHKDVYAKLTGDTANAAAAALTEEELAQWQQLLVDAAEKQITFTTT